MLWCEEGLRSGGLDGRGGVWLFCCFGRHTVQIRPCAYVTPQPTRHLFRLVLLQVKLERLRTMNSSQTLERPATSTAAPAVAAAPVEGPAGAKPMKGLKLRQGR